MVNLGNATVCFSAGTEWETVTAHLKPDGSDWDALHRVSRDPCLPGVRGSGAGADRRRKKFSELVKELTLLLNEPSFLSV